MKCLISVLMVITCSMAMAQNALEGTVTDASDQQPLEQVAVYFPQLDLGTTTGPDGKFKLERLPAGTYKLVVSYLGYQTYSTTLTLGTGSAPLLISLQPSAIEMEEVIVSTPFHKLQRENVMKVDQARVADLKASGGLTLAEGITNIPGVESVSTGSGIGKPVIRGLSSNRVLVYAQGVRLENQQFGDEHGLGVNDAGIESVEVIKGPASLLYGSDALGGVLYLNPERFSTAGTNAGDLQLGYFSNTEGLSANSGYKVSGEHLKFLARAAWASHTDYREGNGLLVTNSRFREWDFKSGLGYQAGKVKTELRYNYNSSRLGIPEGLGEQSRDRQAVAPYQEIGNHILSSDTDLFFEKSSLSLTLGYLFNDRKEFEEEAGPDPALHMKLGSLSYNLQYHLPHPGKLETILGVQGMFQGNENLGEEVLIPDARTRDVGIMGTSHLHLNSGDMQFGLRFDHRSIEGDPNGIPGEESYIPALDRQFNSINAALGYRYDLGKDLIARLNLASGFRAPNLAELTSNGVHEGTNRYEIGNPDLGNESNLQADLSLEYGNQHLELSLNGFYNAISDYIFLEPDGTQVGTDQVFRYRQDNARLYGGEAGLHLHPHPLDWLHFESNLAVVYGSLVEGGDLPLIPATNINNTLRIEFENLSPLFRSCTAFMGVKSYLEQDRVSNFESPTPSYSLWNAGLGGLVEIFGQEWRLQLSVTNLFDKQYVAHLSRLKTDGIANMGRNINLGLSMPF